MLGDGKSVIEKLIPMPLVAIDLKEELRSRSGKPQISIDSLPSLNDKIWGFKEKELVVIGARPSQGKTSFALQLAIDFANQNIPTWFCSLEMDSVSLAERAYCHIMQENNMSVKRGNFDPEKYKVFEKYLEEVQLLITCDLGKSWEDILDAIEIMNPQPKVVILDYIQLIRMSRKDNKESIDEYLSEFKRLAIEKEFCGIICSQINRGAIHGGNMPTLGMLKGSGCLHPDTIIDGTDRKIKEICESGDYVNIYTYNKETGKQEISKPSRLLNTGIKKCRKIKTKSGREIIMSNDTELYNGNEWIKSGNYKVGDKILVDVSR